MLSKNQLTLSILALAALALFAFPLKLGIKVDPAVYAALARDAAEGTSFFSSFWPFHFPVLFPTFYEHPPLTIWMMAFFMKMFGPNMLAASLFSRLCALGSLALLLQMARRSSADETIQKNRMILCGLLLLSWVPWLKYVGAAQLEGPLGLAIICAFALLFKIETEVETGMRSPAQRTRVLLWASLIGFVGFGFKAIIFLPIVLASVVWSLLFSKHCYSKLTGLSFSAAMGLGFGWSLGVLGMLGLDHVFDTKWSDYYWSRALGWGLQGKNQFRSAAQSSPVSEMFSRAFETLHTEFTMSPLWTPFLWGAMIFFFYSQIKKMRSADKTFPRFNSVLWLAVVFYWAFMSPFMIAKIKMPHWPIPIYPVAVLFLVLMFPQLSSDNRIWTGLRKHFKSLVLVLALLLAVTPYPVESRWGRGEEWTYHQEALSLKISKENPLLVVKDKLPLFMVYGYSHWFWGASMPRSYVSFKQIKNSEYCEKDKILWIENTVAQTNAASLIRLGWKPSLHQHKNIRLLECGL